MKSKSILLLIIFILVFFSTVNGDVGPKPSIKIIVKNPPQGEYYLDLLVDYSGYDLYDNIRENQTYSKHMYKLLKDYKVDGWRPALVTGTRVPLNGKLTGEKKGNNMIHNFSYVGVPDRFKVIIVTSDNEIIVSEDIVERKAFNSTVFFDYNTSRLVESSMLLSYILQFISTCLATLIIEGIILILFRFSIKQNYKPFIIINVITQILLTIIVFSAMYTNGAFAAIFMYIPFELMILIAEGIMFGKYLRQHSKLRRVMFAITANVASFILGFAVMLFYPLIDRLF